eukprot:1166094_1
MIKIYCIFDVMLSFEHRFAGIYHVCDYASRFIQRILCLFSESVITNNKQSPLLSSETIRFALLMCRKYIVVCYWRQFTYRSHSFSIEQIFQYQYCALLIDNLLLC